MTSVPLWPPLSCMEAFAVCEGPHSPTRHVTQGEPGSRGKEAGQRVFRAEWAAGTCVVSTALWELGTAALISRQSPSEFPELVLLTGKPRTPEGPRSPAAPWKQIWGLRGTYGPAGSGEGAGSFGMTYLLSRLARSALRSGRALREAKQMRAGEGALGDTSRTQDRTPWEMEGTRVITRPTPLPVVQVGKLRPGMGSGLP